MNDFKYILKGYITHNGVILRVYDWPIASETNRKNVGKEFIWNHREPIFKKAQNVV